MIMKRNGLWGLAAAGLALMISGCSKPADRSAAAPLPAGAAAAPAAAGPKKTVIVKGSDTMVHLVAMLAEEFMKKNAGMEVTVTGGGSGTGVAAMLNGTTDICASSRDLQPKERDLAKQRNINVTEYVIARDGLAVAVHPENPVSELTLAQIKDIYTGKVKDWKEVGGPAMPIVALSRESNSGTYVFFQEHVLLKEDYAPTTRLMPATSAIVRAAAVDKGAIGYVGLGYAAEAGEQLKEIKVKKDAAAPGVAPSFETVKSGAYSVARPLYFYVPGDPRPEVKAFLDFTLGPDGDEIAKRSGYVTK